MENLVKNRIFYSDSESDADYLNDGMDDILNETLDQFETILKTPKEKLVMKNSVENFIVSGERDARYLNDGMDDILNKTLDQFEAIHKTPVVIPVICSKQILLFHWSL